MSEVIVNFSSKHTTEPLPLFVESYEETTERTADVIMNLAQTAMAFAGVERVPRYEETSRENDAEHSFMLALVAPEVAHMFYPHLDIGLVSQYSIVHDLVELETADVATFNLDSAALAQKEAAELCALESLMSRLPSYTARLLQRYENQIEPEARFVRLVDKLLPVVVDILGPGSKVMHEDYCVYTDDQLDLAEQRLRSRLKDTFTEPELQLLHDVRAVLADRFAAAFQSALIN